MKLVIQWFRVDRENQDEDELVAEEDFRTKAHTYSKGLEYATSRAEEMKSEYNADFYEIS